MFRQLMSLEIKLCREHDELLLQTVLMRTHEVILCKMNRQLIIILIILRYPRRSLADKALLVSLPAVNIELIITIVPRLENIANWMAVESTLVNGTGIIVSFPVMLM